MGAAMSERAEKLNVPAHKNRALCAPVYEILITLRDHSTVMGRRPIIVGHKEIQFCSSESRKPVVLPLDHIWSVERPSFGEAESLGRALARSDYGAMDDASRVED